MNFTLEHVFTEMAAILAVSAANLQQRGKRAIGIDFDPQVVAVCRQQGLPVRYGDAEKIVSPSATETLQRGDILVVAGRADALADLRRQAPD